MQYELMKWNIPSPPLSLANIIGAVETYFGSLSNRSAVASVTALARKHPAAMEELECISPGLIEAMADRAPRHLLPILASMGQRHSGTVDPVSLATIFAPFVAGRDDKRQALAPPTADTPSHAPVVVPPPQTAFRAPVQRPLSLAYVVEVAAKMVGVNPADMTNRQHPYLSTEVRYAIAFHGRHLLGKSYGQIAGAIGFDNHTSVIHALRRCEESLSGEPDVLTTHIANLFRRFEMEARTLRDPKRFSMVSERIGPLLDRVPPLPPTIADIGQVGLALAKQEMAISDHGARHVMRAASYLARALCGARSTALHQDFGFASADTAKHYYQRGRDAIRDGEGDVARAALAICDVLEKHGRTIHPVVRETLRRIVAPSLTAR